MVKKVKVAIFHCGFIYSGGGERIVLEEARGLKKLGYDVEVFAPTVNKKNCYPELLEELDVKMFLPSFFAKLPYRNALRMVVTSLLAPFLSIYFRDTDVFIGANQPGAWIAFCMAKMLRKPYIVYLNQPNRIFYPRSIDIKYGWYATEKDYHFLYQFFEKLKPFVSILDRASIRYANRVLVNGGYIKDIIENIYSIRTIDTPAGSNFLENKNLITSTKKIYKGTLSINGQKIPKPYLLITNRHDPQKRFDFVVKAFNKVLKDYKNCSLVIPGPFTEHTKLLVKLVKKLGIKNKVFFLGKISEKDLQRLYKYCCVYCYPSPQEDFGLGPLEAGGWGVLTIAWDHAGPTVTVEDEVTGFLVKPYKIHDYAKKILIVLKDKKLREKLGQKSWERTKNRFSWEKHIETIDKTIKQITV